MDKPKHGKEVKGFRPFELGDIIVAKQDAPYTLTKNGWRGEVTGILPPGNPVGFDIEVDGFEVDSKYFTLAVKGDGSVKGQKHLLVLRDHEDKTHISSFYKIEDMNASLTNILDRGDGLKPHSIRVFEVKELEVDFKISTKIELK